MKLADIVSQIIDIINLLVAFVGSVAVLIFVWGAVRYLFKKEDAHKQAQKEFLGWSLVALFLIVSVFGILKMVQGILVP
ncbi:MAG: hypothetical protein KA066_00250 [Candidatus Pacebacteria bacterium]|nr:hypothetical protein [Candidatus Paceibacterota bacterium]